jgi:hypothetical protein
MDIIIVFITFLVSILIYDNLSKFKAKFNESCIFIEDIYLKFTSD